MSGKFETVHVEVDIVRLDSDIIEEHLRSSTSVLQDILQDSDKLENEHSGHACQQCGKFYKTARTLYSHIALKHPQDKEEVQCSVCDKKYSSELSLQKHVRYMHRYKHRCKACYRTFATAEMLVCHGESCRNNVSPCPTCNKIFNSKLALRNHINYNHSNIEESSEREKKQCYLCRRTFTSSRSLINHMAAIHPAGRTACISCGRTFNTVAAFRRHVLYNHAEYSARCSKCLKLFPSDQSLCRHINKMHAHDQRHFCDSCESFYTNGHLSTSDGKTQEMSKD